jgi:hypothetical protein
MQNKPRGLEIGFKVTVFFFELFDPLIRRLGYKRVNRWMKRPEDFLKSALFDCRMCGQCVLHSTGMTCPMTCPKNIRNGPCGGVRPNGHCEVEPDMVCRWVNAYNRSLDMPEYGEEINTIIPPLNNLLEGSSAWINFLSEADQNLPIGWDAALEEEKI